MKKILLSLSVVSFLCAGNFGDFDKFDDNFDRFMNGPKKTKENKQEQKATEKEQKADEKKSEKDSKKDKESAAKNITRSFDKSFSYDFFTHYSANIEYGFDSDGNINSIAYSFGAKEMKMSDVEYKKLALSKIRSAIQGTLRDSGELMTIKSLISATNKAGANKAMDNLKAQLGNVLSPLKDYNSIEVVDENYNDVEGSYHLKIKVIDDIINQAKAQAK